MKTYEGKRSYGECSVTVDGRALDPRLDLRRHSPDGFEWNYGGSGPAQLALAILADHLPSVQDALDCYQRFKWIVIAGLPRRGWILTSRDVDEAIQRIRRERITEEGAA